MKEPIKKELYEFIKTIRNSHPNIASVLTAGVDQNQSKVVRTQLSILKFKLNPEVDQDLLQRIEDLTEKLPILKFASLDCDDCFGIFSRKAYTDYLRRVLGEAHCIPRAEAALERDRQALVDLINNDDGSPVGVFNGSTRQDELLDKFNHENHTKNPKRVAAGLYFDLLPRICEENVWRFNPLMYPDVQSPVGNEIRVPGGAFEKRYNLNPSRFQDISVTDQSGQKILHEQNEHLLKPAFIAAQMQAAAEEAGGEEVEFLFLDDGGFDKHRPNALPIFEAIQLYFSNYPDEIPENVKLTLIRYCATESIDASFRKDPAKHSAPITVVDLDTLAQTLLPKKAEANEDRGQPSSYGRVRLFSRDAFDDGGDAAAAAAARAANLAVAAADTQKRSKA